MPRETVQFALEPNVFHLWPRGDFTLIALANIDKTFTVTIFAPFALFEKEMNDDAGVVSFFERHFPDALELIGRLLCTCPSHSIDDQGFRSRDLSSNASPGAHFDQMCPSSFRVNEISI
jgi:hypothetical protein